MKHLFCTRIFLIQCIVSVAVLTGCSSESNPNEPPPSDANMPGSDLVELEAPAKVLVASELFEILFEERLSQSPENLSYLGRKARYDEWDDISDAAASQEIELLKKHLARLNELDPEKLSDADKLNLALFKSELETDIENDRWRYHSYPVNQMFGVHSGIPSLLISAHRIESVADAEAYISRVKAVEKKIEQLLAGLKTREEKGIVAPDFVFAQVIDDSKNLIIGAPFDESENDATLLSDFKKKVASLENSQALTEALSLALVEQFKPAYERLIKYLSDLDERTSESNGVWALPDGAAYYQSRLKAMTTTSMTAEEIHQMGLEGVAEIHAEMKAVMKKVGFAGSLAEFFVYMREDPQFYYPNTDEGREQYLAKTQELISAMKAELPSLFSTFPKADVEVRPVEPFREKSAGKAFYQRPSEDGTRDGIYYVNLYDMNDMPNYQMEALAYHEALPGHHMQIAINQEIDGIPKFRKYSYRYTAYVEGWGLYSEYIPKEMGFYSDPYSDFGRLSMALWRAARLVVDTGLHAKRWTREQAIAYLVENTPNSERDCRRAIERYMVMPGQATAYFVGMKKLLELRARTQERLQTSFDVGDFHDLILSSGALPLGILQDEVDIWVEGKTNL